MIKIRVEAVFMTTLLTFVLLFSTLSEVSAQAPYFPLQPVKFKVVKAIWGEVDGEINAAPGDVNIPLIVTIQNIGNSTATGLSMKLLLQEPFKNMSGGRYAYAHYEGSISPGMTGASRFVLNINANATPGEYVLKMLIDYLLVVTGVGKTLYIAMGTEVDVPVLVTGTRYIAIYSIRVFPGEVQPAGNFTVSGTLVNTGPQSFYNVNVSISSPVLIRGTSTFIGQVDTNIPRPFSFLLQVRGGLPNGTFPVRILVTYQDLTLGVTHMSSAVTTVTVQQRGAPLKPPEFVERRGPVEMILEVLWRLFQFFFGFSAPTAPEYGYGGA
ncbi:MAG: hypothetical protein FGF53_08355 [Candidatus Brockarchaeota archaeon]|nr:hypothetical protein [Candidatus Brockarchaeota archaeon]